MCQLEPSALEPQVSNHEADKPHEHISDDEAVADMRGGGCGRQAGSVSTTLASSSAVAGSLSCKGGTKYDDICTQPHRIGGVPRSPPSASLGGGSQGAKEILQEGIEQVASTNTSGKCSDGRSQLTDGTAEEEGERTRAESNTDGAELTSLEPRTSPPAPGPDEPEGQVQHGCFHPPLLPHPSTGETGNGTKISVRFSVLPEQILAELCVPNSTEAITATAAAKQDAYEAAEQRQVDTSSAMSHVPALSVHAVSATGGVKPALLRECLG